MPGRSFVNVPAPGDYLFFDLSRVCIDGRSGPIWGPLRVAARSCEAEQHDDCERSNHARNGCDHFRTPRCETENRRCFRFVRRSVVDRYVSNQFFATRNKGNTVRLEAGPVPCLPMSGEIHRSKRLFTESEHFMSRGLVHSCRIVVVLLGLSTLACQTSSMNVQIDEMTTVILVRHAEKELDGEDPELTPSGADRALALAHVLGEVNVSAVYATPFARTRNTALPLANLLGLEVTVVATGQSFAADMADIVRNEHPGGTVVIVSHSNTTPAIIGELGVTPIPTIDDDEYDDLYVVTITSTGLVSLLPLRYGRETT